MTSCSTVQTTCPAYILTNKVTHARLLPPESAHAFSYPTLALLLPLHALESNALDLGRGCVFGYGGVWGRVIGIRPKAYLYEGTIAGAGNEGEGKKREDKGKTKTRESILEKLRRVVSERGYDGDELYDAWMLTMPSYLGFEGINPLTVYFGYKVDGPLWLVILEIHNTFSERHVHVLCVGKDEDAHPPHGYDHSWTFARQFHVSPFNDRSGYYNCAVFSPTHPPFSSKSEDSTSMSSLPLPTVRIHLYTQPTSSQPSQLKLTATLRPTQATILTTASLFSALAHYPFALLLSFVRIAYQAWILHFRKKLDVYARPEPAATRVGNDGQQESETVENRLPLPENVPQGGAGGGVGWQKEGILETYARGLTEHFLAVRAFETSTLIILESANPALGTITFGPSATARKLTITYRTPRVFTLLLTSPSMVLFLASARDAERIMGVSDEALFREVMTTPSKVEGEKERKNLSVVQSATLALRNSAIPKTVRTSRWTSSYLTDAGIHPLDAALPGGKNPHLRILKNMLVITTLHLLVAIERHIFAITRARFVRGDEPWLVWERTESIIKSCDPSTRTKSEIGGDVNSEYGNRDRDGRGIGSVRREVKSGV